MNHVTHCALRLGDNLAHVHFLRALAKANPKHTFLHYCHAEYAGELTPMIADQPRISIAHLPDDGTANRWYSEPNEFSVNAWKNAGGFWQDHPLKNYYAAFMLEWFDVLAERIGLESPLLDAEDLLFDYPALNATRETNQFYFGPGIPVPEILIVNSPPLSGQAPKYELMRMTQVIDCLSKKRPVACTASVFAGETNSIFNTAEHNWNVTHIGILSQQVEHIIMVSTGPSWPTYNRWNLNRPTLKSRIVINGAESLQGLDPKAQQVTSVQEVWPLLREKGLL